MIVWTDAPQETGVIAADLTTAVDDSRPGEGVAVLVTLAEQVDDQATIGAPGGQQCLVN